jgi:hypothetical protein
LRAASEILEGSHLGAHRQVGSGLPSSCSRRCRVGAQLELLVPVAGPAIMPLSWDSLRIGSRRLALLIDVRRNRDGTEGGVAYEFRGLVDLLGGGRRRRS